MVHCSVVLFPAKSTLTPQYHGVWGACLLFDSTWTILFRSSRRLFYTTTLCQPGWSIVRSSLFRPTNNRTPKTQGAVGSPSALWFDGDNFVFFFLLIFQFWRYCVNLALFRPKKPQHRNIMGHWEPVSSLIRKEESGSLHLVEFSISTTLCQPGWFLVGSSLFRLTTLPTPVIPQYYGG